MRAAGGKGKALSDHALLLYRQMYQGGSPTLAAAADTLGIVEEQAELARKDLARLGLVTHRESDMSSTIHVSPEVAAVQALARGYDHINFYRDSLENTYGVLEEIINQFLPMVASSSGEVNIEMMSDLRGVAAYLDSTTELAREEVLSIIPGPVLAPHLMAEGLARDHRLAARGVRLRAIYMRRPASVGPFSEHLRRQVNVGYELRIAETVPIRLIIFDRQRAVIPIDPNNGSAGAFAIHGETFVRSLVAIFEYCWQHSSDYDGPIAHATDQPVTQQEQAILRMLSTGLKDEKIARNLGVSVRTISRTVSELMQRIGAESRFQAGVKAAKLGWVD